MATSVFKFSTFSDAIYYGANHCLGYTNLHAKHWEHCVFIYKNNASWNHSHPVDTVHDSKGFVKLEHMKVPKGLKAIVHSHPDWITAPGIFSAQDISAATIHRVPVFLITHWRLIRGYDPILNRYTELAGRCWRLTRRKDLFPSISDPDNHPQKWQASLPPYGFDDFPFSVYKPFSCVAVK